MARSVGYERHFRQINLETKGKVMKIEQSKLRVRIRLRGSGTYACFLRNLQKEAFS